MFEGAKLGKYQVPSNFFKSPCFHNEFEMYGGLKKLGNKIEKENRLSLNVIWAFEKVYTGLIFSSN